MSDFLFRMIERASGRWSAQVPRPPQQFQWPVSWERPALVSGPPVVPSPKDPAVSLSSPTQHSLSDSIDGVAQAISPTFTTPRSVSTSMDTEVAPEAKRHNDFADTVRAAASLTTPPGDNSRILSPELAPPAGSDATRPLVPGQPDPYPAMQYSHPTIKDRYPAMQDSASLRASPPGPDERTAKPAAADSLVAALPAIQHEHGKEHTSPAPALLPSTRADSARRIMPHPLQETADPVVEVNIARVEVRLDVPRQPAPQLVTRPRGFAEFESLRRYVAGPWSRRR